MGQVISPVPQDSRPSVEVSHETLIGIGTLLTIIAIISTLGNGSFIVVLLKARKFWRDPHLIMLLTVAVCDLSVSIFGYPFFLVSCFAGTWIFGDLLCQVYAFTCFTLSMISACVLVVISVFRYIIICKPQIKYRLTPRLCSFCIIGAIAYALIWTVTPFLGWSSYTYEPFRTSCSFDWYDQSFGGITYVYATCIFCYAIPLSTMGWCYYKIYQRVSQLKLDPQTPPSANSDIDETEKSVKCFPLLCFDAEVLETTGTNRNKTYKVEIQVFKLNLLMVLTFFFIWSPYAIVSMISVYKSDIPEYLYIFPTLFAKTSCMMNPFLYGLTNATLRQEFRQIWFGGCRKKIDHDFDYQERPSRLNQSKMNCADDRTGCEVEGMLANKLNQDTELQEEDEIRSSIRKTTDADHNVALLPGNKKSPDKMEETI